MDSGIQTFKPAFFSAAHGGAAGRSVVVGAGEMVEAVSHVERELGIGPVMRGTFATGVFGIDDEVAGRFFIFARDGIVAETDDVGGLVFSEKFAVGVGNAAVIR